METRTVGNPLLIKGGTSAIPVNIDQLGRFAVLDPGLTLYFGPVGGLDILYVMPKTFEKWGNS